MQFISSNYIPNTYIGAQRWPAWKMSQSYVYCRHIKTISRISLAHLGKYHITPQSFPTRLNGVLCVLLMSGESSRLHHPTLSPIQYVIYLWSSVTTSARTTINRPSTPPMCSFSCRSQPSVQISYPVSQCLPGHYFNLYSTLNRCSSRNQLQLFFTSDTFLTRYINNVVEAS